MLRDTWRKLPRGSRIGVVIALTAVAPLTPFLVYAGIAVMNVAAQNAQSVVGEGPSVLVGLATFGAYAGLVFWAVSTTGGLLGAAVQRLLAMRKRGA